MGRKDGWCIRVGVPCLVDGHLGMEFLASVANSIDAPGCAVEPSLDGVETGVGRVEGGLQQLEQFSMIGEHCHRLRPEEPVHHLVE